MDILPMRMRRARSGIVGFQAAIPYTFFMRIHVLSDLHLEFASFEPPPTEADLIVLAGDTHIGLRGVEWAARSFTAQPILYLAGNHEFYGQNAPDLVAKLRERGRELGVTVLSDEEVVIDGIRFLGATLWTDFELHDDSGFGKPRRILDSWTYAS